MEAAMFRKILMMCFFFCAAAVTYDANAAANGENVSAPDFQNGGRFIGGKSGEAVFRSGTSGKILSVHVVKTPEKPYFVQYLVPLSGSFDAGDVILISYLMRSSGSSDETGEAETECSFQRNREPWDAVSSGKVASGRDWKRIYLPLVAKRAFSPGEAEISIKFGFRVQSVEISDFSVKNYRKTTEIRNLPFTEFSYEGRAASADWRAEALNRIEKIRTAVISVSVKHSGVPAEGARVSIIQKKNAFAFGTAVNDRYISGKSAGTPDGARYRKEIPLLFNQAVDEGELKWPEWEKDRKKALALAEWCIAQGISFRGHNLVWERWDRMPEDIKALSSDHEALAKRVLTHIAEEAAFFKGKLSDWDVVNEPVSNTQIRALLGPDTMAGWYRTVRNADSSAKLYVNEYNIDGTDDAKLQTFSAMLSDMRNRGVPYDGIGTQCHFGTNPPSISKFLASLDELGKYADELKITEYDINTPDERLAADFTRDILIAAYSHPKVKGFLMWGFWDGMHWRKNAPVYRADWSLKPAGEVWKEYVLGRWKSSAAGIVSAGGIFEARAHLGEYEIVIDSGGKHVKKNVTLGKDGLNVTVDL
jgi:GH35 family endo-1,4-beta-xylanase